MHLDTPEKQARQAIDSALTAAGWRVQSRTEINLQAGNLPPPDVIAADIVEDLRAALEQFAEIQADLARPISEG